MEETEKPKTDKPPYRVPTMDEIRALPWNGLNVVSFFSGGGGSSCGYKMAGYRVLFASEFVQAARDTYAANFPDTILDARDIRDLKPEDVLDQIGLKPNELDILDGSPPCSSFSTAGKREKKWGKESTYSDTKQRTDDLFFEYARMVRGIQPKVFVAENVSGLVKGVAKGYFKKIHAELEACGYRVRARLLDAQWLGVPQSRQRVIFVGVRNDLRLDPVHPTPLPYRYSLAEALPNVAALRTKKGDRDALVSVAPTVQTHGRRSTQSEMTVVDSPGFSDSAELVHEKGYRKGTSLRIGDKPAPTVMAFGIADNKYSSVANRDAPLDAPDIDRFAIGAEYRKLRPGETSERFFNLIRPSEDRPCPTVTATGGISGAASVTHPHQSRKFTMEELRAICSFPPDFQLLGTYQQQWERCGRAVPPVMAMRVAEVIRDQILKRQ